MFLRNLIGKGEVQTLMENISITLVSSISRCINKLQYMLIDSKIAPERRSHFRKPDNRTRHPIYLNGVYNHIWETEQKEFE